MARLSPRRGTVRGLGKLRRDRKQVPQ
jgi:hypothetical protein